MEHPRVTGALGLPADVAAAVTRRWPDRGPAWRTEVETELADLCELHNARPVRVLSSRYAYIIEATTLHGSLIMRASPDPDGMAQGHVSIALANLDAAPRIHELRDTTTGTWTVQQKATPGTPLADLEPTNALFDAIVALFHKIQNQPPPVPAGCSLTSWLRSRLLAGDDLTDLPAGTTPASPAERKNALATLNDLEPGTRPALCHGDASPWNILSAGPDSLHLIDPRGVHGEPEYDLAVVALKAAPVADPHQRATHLASETDTDGERVLAWLTVADAARV